MNSHPVYIQAMSAERLRAVTEAVHLARVTNAESEPVAHAEPPRRRARLRWWTRGSYLTAARSS